MKILLFGKNGQVGWELQRALAPLGDVIALDFDSPGPLSADFSNPESLAATVRAVAPQIIVNAAAHTAVDKAESEPDLATTINADAPGVLAREAATSGAWLMHYSTDYVFDGSGTRPWNEDSPTGPLNVYGRTKLEGEEAIRASGCRHIILRTSWVYGARGGNFAKTMLKLAQEREHLTVIGLDQLPFALVHHPVVATAEQDKIREVGAASADPVHHVMTGRPRDRSVAPRPPATTIAGVERSARRRRDLAAGPSDVDHG